LRLPAGVRAFLELAKTSALQSSQYRPLTASRLLQRRHFLRVTRMGPVSFRRIPEFL
jgi:hypothetical protein